MLLAVPQYCVKEQGWTSSHGPNRNGRILHEFVRITCCHYTISSLCRGAASRNVAFQMENKTAPGNDGINIEFVKADEPVLWDAFAVRFSP